MFADKNMNNMEVHPTAKIERHIFCLFHQLRPHAQEAQ